MLHFDPERIQVMRAALEEVMTKVPSEYSTSTTKVYLAEVILKAAAQGQTGHHELVAAAANQISVVISRFAKHEPVAIGVERSETAQETLHAKKGSASRKVDG
jgi:6,7-dimethyl-8-ribityllumazine synthase